MAEFRQIEGLKQVNGEFPRFRQLKIEGPGQESEIVDPGIRRMAQTETLL